MLKTNIKTLKFSIKKTDQGVRVQPIGEHAEEIKSLTGRESWGIGEWNRSLSEGKMKNLMGLGFGITTIEYH